MGMLEKVIIAGSGGQGIMLLGKVLAEAAMKEGKYVTWLPSYGAEVRGGSAHCMVIISDEEIGSPYIDKADTLIIMNEPSLRKLGKRIKNKGLLIINSSLAGDAPCAGKNTRIVKHPFTDLAVSLGNIKIANMAALGCFIRQKNIVGEKSVSAVIMAMAPKGKEALIEINQKALIEGMKLK
ncbi:MAG: 2-oxoacid:acceptor oxidoreductase family protein [Candidatus Omnitrophica bacterium]|nr:2-oxoacid:acceptor oxidoreductase family protein [Candidatus Omnitrophota bacterium]